ncbi:MAG: glutamate racemase [Deltaproteobacteria bacterium]|nr:glutamate racemase [Deltaproteobacteria bacterium]MBI3388231.1 glutamate racemase [Deltaproteobacteria bacterium]
MAGAIGVFDSGIGGLTVLHELMRELPREQFIYLGDTGRYPYGSKSPETVRRYAVENTDFLIEKGVKLLVVACNTMSSVALEAIAERAAVPVVGVIEPGAAEALRVTRNRRIGVIGTEATIASGAYTHALQHLAERFAGDVEIYTRACPLFVHLAEEGWVDNEIARSAARRYLGSLRQSGIDTLVLGCTHYPLLRAVIGEVMGPKVQLVDSASSTARATRTMLTRKRLARRAGTCAVSFFVTDVPDRFIKVGQRFLGEQVESAVRIER